MSRRYFSRTLVQNVSDFCPAPTIGSTETLMYAQHSMKSSSGENWRVASPCSLVIPMQTSSFSSSWLEPLLFVLNNNRRMLLISFSCWHLPSPSLLQQHPSSCFSSAAKRSAAVSFAGDAWPRGERRGRVNGTEPERVVTSPLW